MTAVGSRAQSLFFLTMVVFAGARAEELPADVTLRQQGHGAILADAKGMTLYTYLIDPKGGPPSCDSVCLEDAWTPLAAPAAVSVGRDWSTVERDDRSLQWTFRGKPLYRYKHDVAPGDMFGDDSQQKWSVAVRPVTLPPGFEISKTALGHTLVDQKRMSLYVSSTDVAACDAVCLRIWKPVEAWWTAVASLVDWAVITRSDGTRQWAFKGKPLYRFNGESAPGETEGNRINGWTVVVLEPPPPAPSWVTVQLSDSGEVLADKDGRTLYVHNLTRLKPGYSRAWETPHMWQPVLAGAADRPIGPWSIAGREDGSRQWTFKGMSLYTYVRDRRPGELHGNSNTDRVWQTIMASGQSMPGAVN